jgi:ABC-type multidrug transport system ATPase subunit
MPLSERKRDDVNATLYMTKPVVVPRTPLNRAVPLDELFHGKQRLVIGRSADCGLCLPHPTVSRYHAALERSPAGLHLRDLNSVNGVFVSGARIFEAVRIQERERIGIGPYLFSLAGNIFYSLDSSQSLRLEARNLEKAVRVGKRQTRKLLDNINLAVEPGEFISLLGPSGSGKSTLMDCLNGRRPATGGKVLANGEDFYRHFDSFRQLLGYVPQRDIVHTQLTVEQALYYTARLRLPTDTEDSELEARIQEVLRMMELESHRTTLIANLSGGQIKRVSLGAELIARPCLLYIDEATSGLDAGTEARMMHLFRQLANEGKSVVCITHNVDNVDRCNQVLILARGKLVFFGPPQEAPGYFGVHRLSEIYDRLADKRPEEWEQSFCCSALHHEFVQKRLDSRLGDADKTATDLTVHVRIQPSLPESMHKSSAVASPAVDRPYRPPLWHQFRVLTARYVQLMWGDRRSLRLLFLQAPLVAAVVLLGFAQRPYDATMPVPRELEESERKALQAVESLLQEHRDNREVVAEQRPALEQIQFKVKGSANPMSAYELLQGLEHLDESQVLSKLLEIQGPVLPGKDIVNPRFTYMLLFIMAVTILWLGCNNAAKEIVKEQAVYGRERAVNLGILPYLGSKVLVLGVFSALQTLLLVGLVYGTLGLLHWIHGDPMPYPDYRLGYLPQYGVLVLLALTGVALGLLLSACVSSTDRANALLPYVLIPQIILGGCIMQFSSGPLYWLAFVTSPVYWAYRAIHLGAGQLPRYVPGYVDSIESVPLACLALVVQITVLLLATAWCLRQKDVQRA